MSSLDLYIKLPLGLSIELSHTFTDYERRALGQSPGKQQYLKDMGRENTEITDRQIMKTKNERCPGSQSKKGLLNEKRPQKYYVQDQVTQGLKTVPLN